MNAPRRDGRLRHGACTPGYADCNGRGDDGCETAVDTDSKSCGRCGRDCLGGACTAGVCQPAVVTKVTNVDPAYAARVEHDNGILYFEDMDVLRSCPTSGCTKAAAVTPETGYRLTLFATDATNAYFVDYNSSGTSKILSCAKTGCAQPTTIATAEQPFGVAADGARVYFATYVSSSWQLVACPNSGCGGAAPLPIATALNSPTDILVVGQRLVWNGADAIWACTLPACADKTQLVLNHATALGTDGTTLFFNTGGPSLQACAASGCGQSPSVLGATVVANPPSTSIVVDDKNVYFAENEQDPFGSYTQRIHACAKSGCTTATVVSEQKSCWNTLAGVAADAKALYWINGNPTFGAALLRLAKP